MLRFVFTITVFTAFVSQGTLYAQTASQADINAAIRKEGLENSKIMNTMHYLTDLYGPRLTGSPNHVNAAKWAAREMLSWGFDKATLEPWEFGHPGWVNERAVGLMLKPVQDTLTFEVLAWTPSTKGVITADVFNLVVPQVASTVMAPNGQPIMQNPTQEELTAYLNSVKADVNGKIVLMGRPAMIPVTIDPPAKRLTDEIVKKRFDPAATPTPLPTPLTQTLVPARPGALSNTQINEQLSAFLIENNAALRINDAAMDHGLIRAFANYTFDVNKVVPTVILRNEDHGRIYRLLSNKTPVRLEFDIRNRTVPDGVTSYNTIGEITGTDKKDEVVMLGGHLDSWHAATGATDNATGCAVMMEAARILKAIGVKPRRTIRVALWSGEEQGLLGSQAYVKNHFGTAENPRPDYGKFNGYFNIDMGTGRARGLTIFGPPEAALFLREVLAPYADLSVAGANTTRSRGLGGSDHTSFNAAGLPGISVNQDPIEYFTDTWHTNLDTYERTIENDVKSSAIVIAAAVYALAMSDDMLPRFNAGEMPAPAKTPTPSPTPTPAVRP